MAKKVKNLFWLNLPPRIMIGAVIIMVPIMVFWTIQNIHKQKEQMTMLLQEKGAALIRSFEAGTRTGLMGMMGMPGAGFQLQRLLMETAQQPDIVHLIVVDERGVVLAHNDPAKIGSTYGQDLDLEKLAVSDQVAWRSVSDSNNTKIFEIFKHFAPSQIPRRLNWRRMMFERMRRQPPPVPPAEESNNKRIIFVGLDMGPLETARQQEMRHTVVMGLILLLIGMGGIFSLFLVQAFQSTRASLKRIQAFSDHLVEGMPIGLLAVDSAQRIIAFNQSAEKILQISGKEVLGKQPREVLPRDFDLLLQARERKQGPIVQELECLLKAGQSIPLEITVSALMEEDGSLLGQMILFKDLSEIQNLKREIETTRRLAALGRLAAGVAHEIRNPLSSIKGFATFFKERYKQNPEDQNTAEIMIQEVDRLNRVITQLLEFARPSRILKKPVDLPGLVQHSLKMIAKQAQAQGVRVRSELAPVGEVVLDADRINQMLLNLYLNALAAMENGGTLNVILKGDARSRKVKLVVNDTGVGIKKEELEHIFDPYFTTQPSGTGLGLAIVHKIIEAHQGEIRVESEPGKGSVFTVILPNP
jgi:two-component system sensor histidine kinase HydH